MKLTFLGTGAADWPAEKDDSMTEFRRMSSLLIDDILLIDPGPQVPEALRTFGKQADAVRYILSTHRHGDHFCAATLDALTAQGAALLPLRAGDEITVGGYTIRAYAGNHGTCRETVHFIITDGVRTLFYGLDGAWLLYAEYVAIKTFKPDFAVFDATIGDCDGDYRIFEHNNLQMVLEMKKTLADYVGRFCISHMARTLHTDHRTLCAHMTEHGVTTAFDGMEVEI